MNFKAGTNVSITESNGTFTFAATDTNTHNSHAINSGKKSDDSTDIKGTASSGEITLGDSGVLSSGTTESYGDTSAQTPGYGDTFKVPSFTVNAKGVVVAAGEHTVKIPDSDNTNTTLSGFAYCETAAGTVAKTAGMPGFALSSGQRILLRTTYTNSASNPTLSVNSTTARPIYIGSSVATSSNFPAGDYIAYYNPTLVSGGAWQLTRIYISENIPAHKYQHNIYIRATTANVTQGFVSFSFITTSNTALTSSTLAAALFAAGFSSGTSGCPASGIVITNAAHYLTVTVYAVNGSTVVYAYGPQTMSYTSSNTTLTVTAINTTGGVYANSPS